MPSLTCSHHLNIPNSGLPKPVQIFPCWPPQKSSFSPTFPHISLWFWGPCHNRFRPLRAHIPSLCSTDMTMGHRADHSPHLPPSPPSVSPIAVSFSPHLMSAWQMPIVPFKCILHTCFLNEQKLLPLFTILQVLKRMPPTPFLYWPHQEIHSPTMKAGQPEARLSNLGSPVHPATKAVIPASPSSLTPREERQTTFN